MIVSKYVDHCISDPRKLQGPKGGEAVTRFHNVRPRLRHEKGSLQEVESRTYRRLLARRESSSGSLGKDLCMLN